MEDPERKPAHLEGGSKRLAQGFHARCVPARLQLSPASVQIREGRGLSPGTSLSWPSLCSFISCIQALSVTSVASDYLVLAICPPYLAFVHLFLHSDVHRLYSVEITLLRALMTPLLTETDNFPS